jgi:hypothetical protein
MVDGNSSVWWTVTTSAGGGGLWMLLPLIIISINKCKKIKQTHHHLDQLSNGLDVGPDPFAMGLQVNGTGRQADDQATRALLGVYF